MAQGEKLIAQNRRARHDFQVFERHEAGIALRGTEVKSLRNGKVSFKDSYADLVEGELYLKGVHIAPYEQGNIHNHDPERPRKLLMHKDELIRLGIKKAEKGLTLVPLRLYFKNGKAKAEIGLCKGKQKADKRETLRERVAERETDRYLKEQKHR